MATPNARRARKLITNSTAPRPIFNGGFLLIQCPLLDLIIKDRNHTSVTMKKLKYQIVAMAKRKQQRHHHPFSTTARAFTSRSNYFLVRLSVLVATAMLFVIQYFVIILPMMKSIVIPAYSELEYDLSSKTFTSSLVKPLVDPSFQTTTSRSWVQNKAKLNADAVNKSNIFALTSQEEDDKGTEEDGLTIEQTWLSNMSCKILFHIHIPKTAGTSILTELKNATNYGQTHQWERKNVYWRHGRLFDPIIPKLRHKLRELTQQQTQENNKDSHLKPILLSAEVGINDLIRIKYPFFDETCFFTVHREPHSWLLSAANHLMSGGKYKGGIYGKVAFLDTDNIQSAMSGYKIDGDTFEDFNNDPNDNVKQKHTTNFLDVDSNNAGKPATTPRPGSICAYSLDDVKHVLCAAIDIAKEESLHPVCTDGLGHSNIKKHQVNITTDARDIVQKRYQYDLDLWEQLSHNNGRLCW